MLKFYLLNNKLFSASKSILFLDYYLSITVSYILCNFVNSFSILVLERYLLDYLFRGFLVCISINSSRASLYSNVQSLYVYSIYTFNVLFLFVFI